MLCHSITRLPRFLAQTPCRRSRIIITTTTILARAGASSPYLQRGFCLSAFQAKDNKPETKNSCKQHDLHTGPPIRIFPDMLTESKFHQVADQYLESVLWAVEQLQDSREDIEVEYSVNQPSNSPFYLFPGIS
ncbi:hypothetical protein E4U55_008178 [Claviceps digitariae]|nr:hypothetical protein E4U55_008178 [Claviceps digitariae]